MKKKVIAVAAFALITVGATAAVANASDSPSSPGQGCARTVERPAGTESIPAQKMDGGVSTDSNSQYSKTVEMPAGTDHVPAHRK
ncbi:hypothetical protein AB0J38_08260 [Streptomyces sp. NPDC050095]|uniref:hypothetical protein n=1 Tax=unclassified Streptomyces TaxID=2593676 RepID=UPI003448FB59